MIGLVPRFIPGRRRWVTAVVALVLAGGIWGAGFLWFIRLTAQQAAVEGTAGGIVVLTGGADRIEAALRLFAAGRADRLLISGIGGGADLAVLGRRSGVDTASLAGRVTLGRNATSTHGNARETASWVRENQIRTLIVVTAFYHMPRALVELHRVLPGVTLLAAPVLTWGSDTRPEAGRAVSLRRRGRLFGAPAFAG